MSTDEIQFGDLEETVPDVHLRPDQNKHYAVVEYENPDASDLPIFVDVDVVRDMEAHALSDTSVELGGVLLGGQFEDEAGRPFVVVNDSLRAEHYESTKGSFKFTHDTWSEITRQRDEFPDDIQMVGWYHTHPDWGVFLSGMDMFICDNFFNKPLDIALVIDPCRGDRGMFMWTGNPASRIRRTSGFFLTASRFRRQELEIYASQLKDNLMPNDPRYSAAGYGAPIVNVHESRSSWMMIGVMGMLSMQFLLLCLVAWRMLASGSPESESAYAHQVLMLAKEREFLDQFYGSEAGTKTGLVTDLQNTKQQNELLQAASIGLNSELQRLERQNAAAAESRKALDQKFDQFSKSYDDLKARHQKQTEQLAKLKAESSGSGQGSGNWFVENRYWLVGGAVILGIVAVIASTLLKQREPDPFRDAEQYGDDEGEANRDSTPQDA